MVTAVSIYQWILASNKKESGIIESKDICYKVTVEPMTKEELSGTKVHFVVKDEDGDVDLNGYKEYKLDFK